MSDEKKPEPMEELGTTTLCMGCGTLFRGMPDLSGLPTGEKPTCQKCGSTKLMVAFGASMYVTALVDSQVLEDLFNHAIEVFEEVVEVIEDLGGCYHANRSGVDRYHRPKAWEREG